MVSKKIEEKPADLETRVDEQLGLMGEPTPLDQKVKGAYTCFIKGNDGTIERIEAKSFWKLIFILGGIIPEKYYGQFVTGVVFKIIRNPDKK